MWPKPNNPLAMVPLSSSINPRLWEIATEWKRRFKGRPRPPDFVFAVPDTVEDDAAHQLKPLASNFDVSILTVPHKAMLQFPEVKADWARSRFGEIALYRNLLLDEARRRKPDMAVFLDSDIVPPRDGFDILWESRGIDGVTAGVVKTFNNNWDEVYGFGKFKEPFFTGLEWAEKIHEGVAGCGFANTAAGPFEEFDLAGRGL